MPSFQPAEEEEVRRRKRAPWGVIALVLLTGLALMRNGSGEFNEGPPQPAVAAAPDGRASTAPALPKATQDALPFSMVERVRIPAINVNAPVTTVGLDPDGWVQAPPPDDSNLAGWFTGAVAPGQKGTAVIVGHVDNSKGPAVFYGLGSLKKGNRVEVRRADHKTAVFEIYGIEVFSKANFPGQRVYGNTGQAELRVITCGGGFTKQFGYDGNVVVFARLVDVR
ncbi:class F sortase [Streptomyces sp. NPDC002577]